MTETVKKFEDVTDDDLKRELKRREDVRKEEARLERAENLKLVLEHRDTLLKFIKHGRSSCESTPNGFYGGSGSPRCNRCALEELDEWDDSVEVFIEITLRRVED